MKETSEFGKSSARLRQLVHEVGVGRNRARGVDRRTTLLCRLRFRNATRASLCETASGDLRSSRASHLLNLARKLEFGPRRS
jgi:hypothetical protein